MRTPAAIALLVLAASACKSTNAPEVPRGAAMEEAARVRVVYEGSRSFSSERLDEVIAPDLVDLERRRSLRAAIDDAAYSLEVFYRGEGYPACEVRYETEPPRDGVVPARLIITEGPRVAIENVRFRGVTAVDADELRTFVLPPRRWWILPRSRVWFVAGRLADSLRAIEAYYHSLGYLDASAELTSPDPVEGPWKDRIDVRLTVEEGPRYTLRTLQLLGGIPKVDAGFPRESLLQEDVHLRLGATLRGRLAEHYARAGYPDARVELEEQFDPEQGAVDVVLRIDPGPLVRIGAVVIDGDLRTDRSRILGALTLREGSRYDVEKRRQSFRNLYRLGVFSSVGLSLKPMAEGVESGASADGSEERTLRVQLEEAPSREIYLEPGYGSYERLRAVIGWRERNLFGGARVLSLEGLVSEKALRATADVIDPRFLNSESMAVLSLFGGRREEPSFTRSDVGATTTLVRELRRNLRLAAAYQYRYSGVEAGDPGAPIVQGLTDDVNISSVSLTPSWDTRDSVFFPVEGSLVRLSTEWGDGAIGSELDFLRTRWALAHFRSLDDNSVLGLSWRGGLIAPTNTTQTIPLQERFFNGGENTVRSFREDQLGPKDINGDPIGGEAYNVFTVELRERLVGRLELGLFYDIGNVALDYSEVLSFNDMRSGVGMGLRYALPVGPIRLDGGWNPNPRDEEDSYVIHLSVGLSF